MPARQEGALQRLKATSLSALLAHFSTDSAAGQQDLKPAGDVAGGADLTHDQQPAAVGREPGRLDVSDVGIGRGGGQGVEAPGSVGGAAQDPELGPGGQRLDGQRGEVARRRPAERARPDDAEGAALAEERRLVAGAVGQADAGLARRARPRKRRPSCARGSPLGGVSVAQREAATRTAVSS